MRSHPAGNDCRDYFAGPRDSRWVAGSTGGGRRAPGCPHGPKELRSPQPLPAAQQFFLARPFKPVHYRSVCDRSQGRAPEERDAAVKELSVCAGVD